MIRTRALRSPLATLAVAALLAAACGDSKPEAEQSAPAAAAGDTTAPQLDRLGYERGDDDAPVTVIEFSDFGCPYCAEFANETYPKLHREFVEPGQVRWRYIPIVLGIFPNGDVAALASECAGEQDRFWPMHDLLYENQREWKTSDDPRSLFPGYARSLGFNPTRFATCMEEDGAAAARVRRNTAAAERLGVRATPSFLVNGRPVQGALPLEQFRMLIQWAGAGGGDGGTQLAPAPQSPKR